MTGSGGSGDGPDQATGDRPTEEVATAPPCEPVADVAPSALRATADGPTLDADRAVAAAVDCVEEVLVVPDGDAAAAAVAVPLAVATGAPLLIGPPDRIADLLEELGDPQVRELPDDPTTTPDDDPTTTPDGDPTTTPDAGPAAAVTVAEELDTRRFVAAAADRPADLVGAAALAVRTDAAVLPVPADGTLPSLPDDAEVVALGDLDDVLPDAAPAGAPWIVDADASVAWVVDPAAVEAPVTLALAALRGDTVVPVTDGDLLARRTVSRVRDAGVDGEALVAVGPLAGDPARDLTLLTEAPLLPGGVLRSFDGTRMVALYGRPGAASLGVLGEQDLDATIERAREVTEGYGADGRDVIPTLEVIASVATGAAGEDGDYSNLTPAEEFTDLVTRAGQEGFQVILDLQPGRTDFLTQARMYEELLLEPHVGLALDPEWRLEDDQVHLRQIGSVDADEVQRVVDWYAELTRDAGLSQQVLVLHQFRLSMLPDRDTIEVPRELAAVVHADGQGPQGVKLDTWRALTAGAEDRWHWGWKNFYDEDPTLASPEDVLSLEPEVVLVTFQ